MSETLQLRQSTFPYRALTALTAAGCLAFILAKSLNSPPDKVTVAHVQYWIAGLVPLAVLAFCASLMSRIRSDQTAVGAGILPSLFALWIACLSVFIFMSGMFYSEVLRLPLYRAFDFRHLIAANIILSFIYVALGFACWIIVSAIFRQGYLPRWATPANLIGLFALNWLMFFALVYALPNF